MRESFLLVDSIVGDHVSLIGQSPHHIYDIHQEDCAILNGPLQHHDPAPPPQITAEPTIIPSTVPLIRDAWLSLLFSESCSGSFLPRQRSARYEGNMPWSLLSTGNEAIKL
jgi:hypothetical protein